MRVAASHTGRALAEADSPLPFGAVNACEMRAPCKRAPGPTTRRGSRLRSRFTAPANTISRTSTSIWAQQIHRNHRDLGQRQEHLGFRYSIRRGAKALPRILECLRAAVRATGVAARCRCHLRHSAHCSHRAAHQPRRTQEHGGDAHRDLSFFAPCSTSSWGCSTARLARSASSRNPRTPSPRACSKITVGKASLCWRPASWRARACIPRSRNGPAARDFRTCWSMAN